MAYFLDPELNALATGQSRRPSTGAAPADSRRKNKFGKSCKSCGTWVAAQKGYLANEGGAWVVYCATCP